LIENWTRTEPIYNIFARSSVEIFIKVPL
jgi:hypothetical protein